jgi:hypothetical protein
MIKATKGSDTFWKQANYGTASIVIKVSPETKESLDFIKQRYKEQGSHMSYNDIIAKLLHDRFDDNKNRQIIEHILEYLHKNFD